MNPYVTLNPVRVGVLVDVAVYFLPAFLTLVAVVVIVGRSRWLSRNRPLSRFEARDLPSSLWAVPILVWAFLATVSSLRATHLEGFYMFGAMGRFLHVYMMHAFLMLGLLIALQLVAVLVLERGRLGLGSAGHARVGLAYAVMAVVLDSFLLLTVAIGNWPR